MLEAKFHTHTKLYKNYSFYMLILTNKCVKSIIYTVRCEKGYRLCGNVPQFYLPKLARGPDLDARMTEMAGVTGVGIDRSRREGQEEGLCAATSYG
jgi:hypothetical protein